MRLRLGLPAGTARAPRLVPPLLIESVVRAHHPSQSSESLNRVTHPTHSESASSESVISVINFHSVFISRSPSLPLFLTHGHGDFG